MVTDSWKNVTLICDNHKGDLSHDMELHQGREGMSVFYSCPCFSKPEANGRKCNNRLNIVDYEGMLEKMMNEFISDDGGETNLEGFKWSKKGVDFKVISHKDNKFGVAVKNRKAIGK